VSRVFDYLQGRGVTFTVIPHRETSARRAPALRVLEDEVVKTEVVIANFGPALMVIPASRTLDPDLVARAVGDATARRATDEELRRAFPEYEPGTVPPLSMLLLVPMFVDPAVAAHHSIVFAAGRSDVSIRVTSRDLFGVDPVVVVPITAESETVPAAPAG
jgi:prolyl-tRNA editing enzyme YbaK/EbsC (Cys-tRNA(Pro) deacylase)